MKLLDPDEEVLQVFKSNESDTVNVSIEDSGNYQLEICGDHRKGSYDIK
jgi:hypothetical protein